MYEEYLLKLKSVIDEFPENISVPLIIIHESNELEPNLHRAVVWTSGQHGFDKKFNKIVTNLMENYLEDTDHNHAELNWNILENKN